MCCSGAILCILAQLCTDVIKHVYNLVVSTTLQGPVGKASVSSVSTAAHARTMRKGSSDHLVLNIGSESERLIAAQDSDDKGIAAFFFCAFVFVRNKEEGGIVPLIF